MSDNIPNLLRISMNSRDLEAATPESINNLFTDVFGIDPSLPDWASAPANGNWFPSAQLSTRDGRVTGNAVLMWWTIISGIPAAVVATDAGNVIIVTQAELEYMFYAPEFLMREPLYAHLAGVAAADIAIPDEFRFLFEISGVPLDEDEAADDFETYVEGSNPIVVAMMEVIMDNLVEPEVVEDQVYLPSEDLDFGDSDSFVISMIDSNGNTMTESFDTLEELNEFMAQMDIPLQI